MQAKSGEKAKSHGSRIRRLEEGLAALRVHYRTDGSVSINRLVLLDSAGDERIALELVDGQAQVAVTTGATKYRRSGRIVLFANDGRSPRNDFEPDAGFAIVVGGNHVFGATASPAGDGQWEIHEYKENPGEL